MLESSQRKVGTKKNGQGGGTVDWAASNEVCLDAMPPPRGREGLKQATKESAPVAAFLARGVSWREILCQKV